MTEKEKMHSGDLYLPDDPDIVREQTACLEKLYDFSEFIFEQRNKLTEFRILNS